MGIIRTYDLTKCPVGTYDVPFLPSQTAPAPDRPRGLDGISGIVVHTTGYAPCKLYLKSVQGLVMKPGTIPPGSPFDQAIRLYTECMKEGPHFIVDSTTGKTVQVLHTGKVAWGVGHARTDKYVGDWQTQYACKWWGEWAAKNVPGVTSPLSMPVWAGGSCNNNVVHIEVVPNIHSESDPWTPKGFEALGFLLARVVHKHDNIKLEPGHIVTHSQAHPIARTSGGKPWDLCPTQSDQLDALMVGIRESAK